MQRTSLAAQQLNHFADRHAARKAVGVHNEVWTQPTLTKGKVLLLLGGRWGCKGLKSKW